MFDSLTARLFCSGLFITLTSSSPAADYLASRIRLDVLEPANRSEVIRGFPVSVGLEQVHFSCSGLKCPCRRYSKSRPGLVFPDGELSSVSGGRLVDDHARPVPFEVEAGRMIEFTLRGCRSPAEWRQYGWKVD